MFSLYPGVQSSLRGERWPLGSPRILIGVETEKVPELGKGALGIWACRVRPPATLHFPILPIRRKDKLYFALCTRCTELEADGKVGYG